MNYGDLNQFGGDQESTLPDSSQVTNQILYQAQGSPIQKLQQAQDPLAKIQVAQQNQQAQQGQQQQGQENNFGDLANSAAYLGSRGLKEQVKELLRLLDYHLIWQTFYLWDTFLFLNQLKQFKIYQNKLLILFLETSTRKRGEKWLGSFVEDLAGFLTPGGVLGKVGKLSKLQKLESIGKL